MENFIIQIQSSLNTILVENFYKNINYPLQNVQTDFLVQMKKQSDRVKWNFVVSFVRWLDKTGGVPINSPSYENCIEVLDRSGGNGGNGNGGNGNGGNGNGGNGNGGNGNGGNGGNGNGGNVPSPTTTSSTTTSSTTTSLFNPLCKCTTQELVRSNNNFFINQVKFIFNITLKFLLKK